MLRTVSAPAAAGEMASGPPSIDIFPVNYSVLLAGPPGVGKFEYFLDLVRQSLEQGKRVVFVTLDIHPAEVRRRAKEKGLDIESFEGRTFLFVDCYSAISSDKPELDAKRRMYQVSSFSNLEGISMAMAKASNDLKAPVMIFFYTLSTLFLHNSQQAISKFMQIITSRVKTHLGFIAYAVHEGVHDQMTVNLLRSLVDGVIETRFTEDLRSEIRIHHMRGLRADTSWGLIEGSAGIEVRNIPGNALTGRIEP
jgi:KaiC/GvpD/RAD55 family RecA-like ATPase